MKRLGLAESVTKREGTTTVNLIRDSTVTLPNEVAEEDGRMRRAVAASVQHSESTSSRYYNFSQNKGAMQATQALNI